MTTTFPARFSSRCIACDAQIHEGDSVKWLDGAVVHETCTPRNSAFDDVPAACPRCFMVPTTNGSCGCDA